MSTNWTCPQCGGTTYHFNRSRNALVCDCCAGIVQTDAERTAEIQFERTLGLARQHLQVGNWDEAARITRPLCTSKPADKQLYLILLAAVTKGYSDYLLHNECAKKEAAGYWDKLKRLNCVNDAMLNYAGERKTILEQERKVLSLKKLSLYIVGIFLSIISACGISSNSGGGVFLFLIGIFLIYKCMGCLSRLNKEMAPYKNHTGPGSENPFL